MINLIHRNDGGGRKKRGIFSFVRGPRVMGQDWAASLFSCSFVWVAFGNRPLVWTNADIKCQLYIHPIFYLPLSAFSYHFIHALISFPSFSFYNQRRSKTHDLRCYKPITLFSHYQPPTSYIFLYLHWPSEWRLEI